MFPGLSPQPLDYLNCDGRQTLPRLLSGIDFRAFWLTNVAYVGCGGNASYCLVGHSSPLCHSTPMHSTTRFRSVSRFWVDWLRARRINPRRLYNADMCVSLWVSRKVEITLKVTSICETCKPNQLQVEPYIYDNYVKGKERVQWTFSKVRTSRRCELCNTGDPDM